MAYAPPRPTDAELEILTVLWSIGGPATVRDVYNVIDVGQSYPQRVVKAGVAALELVDLAGERVGQEDQADHRRVARQPAAEDAGDA